MALGTRDGPERKYDTTQRNGPPWSPMKKILDVDNDSSQQVIGDINNMHPAHQDTGNVGGRRLVRRLPAADEVHIFRLGSMASALTTQTDTTDSTPHPLSEVLGHQKSYE